MDQYLDRCKKALSDWIDMSMHVSFRSHIDYFKKKGLSRSQVFTMHMLSHKQECKVGDVSRMLSVSNPAASQLLDQLVNIGLAERYESSKDRRIRLHRLSAKGAEMIRESHLVRKDWYQSVFQNLSDSELKKTSEVLELLNNRLRQTGDFGDKYKHGDCE